MAVRPLATKYKFENFGAVRWNSRGGSQITTIEVHHMATTNFNSVPGVWATREASAHYGIGPNGEIRAYVDEDKRAWHAGNANSYSIGIECANTSLGPNWLVSDATVTALVKLIQDIKTRHPISKIEGHRDAPGNATACPGPSLYPRLAEIRTRVAAGAETTPTIIEEPVKASLDLVNLNSQTFQITGWLLNSDTDLRGRIPWLFILDSITEKEIARVEGIKIDRPDVAKIFPNPSGSSVGMQFDGQTPAALTRGNGQYKVMFRYSDDVGNTSFTEKTFDDPQEEAPDINTGNLDGTQPTNGKLNLNGWHLWTGQKNSDYHFLFLMDANKGTEIARWNVTMDSYQPSRDISAAFPNNKLVQSNKCRFNTTVDVPANTEGKKTFIMSRYCSDPTGNSATGEGDYRMADTLIFL